MSTEPEDPTLYDINVDNIPAGEWRVRTFGADMQNQNSMRVPFAVCGLDELGDTFCPTVLLDVTIEGEGDGTVDSDNPAILCGSIGDEDCEEIYDRGALVTLTATPEPLSDFVGWSGDPECTGDPTNPVLNLQMDMDISCIATFALLPVLDVIIEGNGVCTVTSEPAGIDCPDDCDEIIDSRGATVTLTAVPDEISTFIDWTGDCDDQNPATSITVNEDSTCIATCITQFVLNPIFPTLDDNINSISAENALPNCNVAIAWGRFPGSFIVGGRTCNGIELGIDRPRLLAIERANDFGVATYIFYIPLFGDFEYTLQLQAIDIETCRVSNQIEQFIRKDDE